MQPPHIQLPPDFIQRMRLQLGSDFEAFMGGYEQSVPTSIRYNPLKQKPEFGITTPVPWCELGVFLERRPNFTNDPHFHAGAYYVQEASSMFVGSVLEASVDLSKDLNILDLAAAPGGKTTLLQSMVSKDSLILANEVINSRNKTLAQNISRWGADNIWVCQNDARTLGKLHNYFDVILVDAPCSGEGMFRKDPTAVEHWSLETVQHCAQRQKRILAEIIPALAPGGILIYSTCTFAEAENEENVHWAMTEGGLALIDPDLDEIFDRYHIEKTAGGLRFYHHRVRGEGFFLAALQKPTQGSGEKRPRRASRKRAYPALHQGLERWLLDPARFSVLERGGHEILIPHAFTEHYTQLSKSVYLTRSGLNMGKSYPKGLRPSPELALFSQLSPKIPKVDLSLEQARQYLAHQPIPDLDRRQSGIVLVRFEGNALGWINILNTGQTRNYYPSAWRILRPDF